MRPRSTTIQQARRFTLSSLFHQHLVIKKLLFFLDLFAARCSIERRHRSTKRKGKDSLFYFAIARRLLMSTSEDVTARIYRQQRVFDLPAVPLLPLVLMVLSPVPSLREERPRPGRERNIELGFRRKSNRRSRERRRGESSCEVFFFEKKSSKPAAFSTSSTSTRHFLLCSLIWRPINYFSSCSSVM